MKIKIIHKAFQGNTLFDNFEFDFGPSCRLAIVGPSGIGKTTLINCLSGIDNKCQRNFDPAALNIGMVFQEPRLLPWRTVEQNLRLTCHTDGQRNRISATLEQVGLPQVESLFPAQLSLGMQRRVAIARALLIEPDILVLDEAFSSLDQEQSQSLHTLIQQQLERFPTMRLVMITHQISEIRGLANEVILLKRQNQQQPVQIGWQQKLPLASDANSDGELSARWQQLYNDYQMAVESFKSP